jgi:hypothetical protein
MTQTRKSGGMGSRQERVSNPSCSWLLPLRPGFLGHGLYVFIEPPHVIFTAARVEHYSEANLIGLIYDSAHK